MILNQSNACSRLCAIGIPKETRHQILNCVSKWIKHNGEEWTVARLKMIKVYYLNYLAGTACPVPWLALKADRKPRGPFGVLFDSDIKNPRSVMKSLSALMVYSATVSRTVTPQQWEKFRKSTEDSTPKTSSFTFGYKPKITGKPVLRKPIFETLFSDQRRAPYWDSTKGRTLTAIETDIEKWFWPSLCNKSVVKTGILTNTMGRSILDELKCSDFIYS